MSLHPLFSQIVESHFPVKQLCDYERDVLVKSEYNDERLRAILLNDYFCHKPELKSLIMKVCGTSDFWPDQQEKVIDYLLKY